MKLEVKERICELNDDLTVRIAGIVRESLVDGPGLRNTVFFQGCPHGCNGCHNPETWDPEAGLELTLSELIKALKINPLINGVTFSGGEPFLQAEPAAEVGHLVKKIGLDLWVYTGYCWEYLHEHQTQAGIGKLIEIADVIVDGPFEIQHRTLTTPFIGSSNQRLISVQASLQSGTVIQWIPPAEFKTP